MGRTLYWTVAIGLLAVVARAEGQTDMSNSTTPLSTPGNKTRNAIEHFLIGIYQRIKSIFKPITTLIEHSEHVKKKIDRSFKEHAEKFKNYTTTDIMDIAREINRSANIYFSNITNEINNDLIKPIQNILANLSNVDPQELKKGITLFIRKEGPILSKLLFVVCASAEFNIAEDFLRDLNDFHETRLGLYESIKQLLDLIIYKKCSDYEELKDIYKYGIDLVLQYFGITVNKSGNDLLVIFSKKTQDESGVDPQSDSNDNIFEDIAF